MAVEDWEDGEDPSVGEDLVGGDRGSVGVAAYKGEVGVVGAVILGIGRWRRIEVIDGRDLIAGVRLIFAVDFEGGGRVAVEARAEGKQRALLLLHLERIPRKKTFHGIPEREEFRKNEETDAL